MQDWLIEAHQEHPEFHSAAQRAPNEMLNNFLNPGLAGSLRIAAPRFTWGIPVDFDPKHTVYVWVDALTQLYQLRWAMTLMMIPWDFKKYLARGYAIWSVRRLSVSIPSSGLSMLHGARICLCPSRCSVTAGWSIGGGKMSKSKGNVVDPVKLCERYSSDAVRYFLMREMPFGADGEFYNEALHQAHQRGFGE